MRHTKILAGSLFTVVMVSMVIQSVYAAPRNRYQEDDRWEERQNRAQPPEKVIPCLKPGGRLVIIEHDCDKYGDRAGWHCTPQNELIDEAYRAGFHLVRIETFLDKDNINIFIPRSRIKEAQ